MVDRRERRGARRLDLPDDLVALEVTSALDRGILVIPVLVDGGRPPRVEELPQALAPLAHRQCLRIDHETFSTDAARLLTALEPAVLASGPAADAPTLPPRAGPKLRHLALFGTPIAIVAIIAFVVMLSAPTTGTSREPNSPVTSTAPAAAAPSACTDVADGASFVQPQVTESGRQSGLTFCPPHINDGRLPISGKSFDLAGQVLGPADQRQEVLLVNHGDPTTCDALGNPPASGAFLISQADIGSAR